MPFVKRKEEQIGERVQRRRSAPKDGRVSKAKILNVQPPIISITSSGFSILSLSLSLARARALAKTFFQQTERSFITSKMS